MISLLTSITDFWWGNLFFSFHVFKNIQNTTWRWYRLWASVLFQVSHLDPNIVVQIFSPLVTSQRIMATQFNNPYTSVTCQDGTTVVFQEVCVFPQIQYWNRNRRMSEEENRKTCSKHDINEIVFPSVCRLFICWCWTSRRVSSSAPYKHDYTNGSISSWTMCYHVSTGVLSYKYFIVKTLNLFCFLSISVEVSHLGKIL